ncbi:hypothetical protein [Burkholderia lata]|uniref:hypothetical protein n=1 Tax=Burkholderia lata (strain ATCC 17760 / DSM 23089 / LMG 22485 / NCIMB 9086 / R18194 / 383) TaxID=482957 RepID=UPI0015826C2B|nr:hypothetical protein [Burkholderia lata]
MRQLIRLLHVSLLMFVVGFAGCGLSNSNLKTNSGQVMTYEDPQRKTNVINAIAELAGNGIEIKSVVESELGVQLLEGDLSGGYKDSSGDDHSFHAPSKSRPYKTKSYLPKVAPWFVDSKKSDPIIYVASQFTDGDPRVTYILTIKIDTKRMCVSTREIKSSFDDDNHLTVDENSRLIYSRKTETGEIKAITIGERCVGTIFIEQTSLK